MNFPHAGAGTKHPKSQQRHTNPQRAKPGAEQPIQLTEVDPQRKGIMHPQARTKPQQQEAVATKIQTSKKAEQKA
jgi:hypothetical protein